MCAAVSNRGGELVSIIFLEIDGVLVDRVAESEQIGKELDELKKSYPYESEELLHKRAATHCFSREASKNFDCLIQKVHEFSTLRIVFSSSWRDGVNVEDIKTRVLLDTSFAHLIVDKTVDSEFTSQMTGDEPIPSERCQELYGFSLDDLRGREIDFYLRENYGNIPFANILILDSDPDSEIPLRFPHHFVHVDPKELFSEKHLEKSLSILQNSPFSFAKN